MTDDDSRKIVDATLNKVKQFTVGLGRAGEKPAAEGSGVLVKQGELTGILTCAHVATHLRELKRPPPIHKILRSYIPELHRIP